MFKHLALVAFAAAITMTSALAQSTQQPPPLPPQPKVRPAGIPDSFVMVSPCVQGMGEHWLDPKKYTLADGAMGPIYGTYEGKAIFSEIMVPVATLQKGFNYRDLMALPGQTINHIDVEYHPKGHEGMPIPHYDIHAYYVSHAEHLKMCPNGAPDPDMEKAAPQQLK